MGSKTKRRQRGATLLEALVALGLFAIAASAFGTLLTQQIRMQTTNGTSTQAVALGEKELEDIRALDYDQIASRTNTATVGYKTFTITTKVVPDSPAPNMKSVTTTVSWTEPNGAQKYTIYAIYTDITR
jgi:Tfp pilus assembly protein PilV